MEQKKPNTERMIGFILLIPPLISVLLFVINLLSDDIGEILEMKNLSSVWTGWGDSTSPTLPVYFGLMAIAGVYLIRKRD